MVQLSVAGMTTRIGDYKITRELPSITDEVLEFEATHVLLPRCARLRVLGGSYSELAKRLMREACILEALHHVGVPRIFECGRLEDRRVWIAIELVDGPTLADAIADRPLLPDETLALLRDLALILHHAHARGVVHGRLRPELVVRETTGVYITEWGGARTHDGDEPFDPSIDVYALGLIARAALGESTGAVGELVARMIASTPLARPTAAEVRDEAIHLLAILEAPPPDDLDGAIVEEIDVELTEDLSKPRRLRWTPPIQNAPFPENVVDPLADRR